MLTNITRQIRKAALLLAVLPAMLSGCTFLVPPQTEAPEEELKEILFFIPSPIVGTSSASQFVYVTAAEDWKVEIEYNGDQKDWVTLSALSGSKCDNFNLVLQWTANTAAEERSVLFTLTSGSESTSSILSQSGKTSGGGGAMEIKESVPSRGWLELPATDNTDLYFISHDMTVGNYTGRNYSYYYDVENLLARWVAYPLNKSLASSGSRTNAWGLDPKVPIPLQPVLFSGFKRGTDGNLYDRGHQQPSADRLEANSNKATFYGTNMTPQLGALNQRCWASLESAVRDWSYQFDTLYVVTGADVRGATHTSQDNYGKNVTIPTGYYKALLGYKKNGQFAGMNQTGGYTAIGFYFEHKSYTDSRETIKAQSMSIDELEKKLGIDFFVNLPGKIGQDYADKVESKVDTWWFNK